MEIRLQNTGKRYNRTWIFRGIEFTLPEFSSLALVGNNGSGKSTLLQLIYNYQTLSEGTISYFKNGEEQAAESIYASMAFVAPYLDLPEEFTLNEIWDFHFSLKPLRSGVEKDIIFESCGPRGNENKPVRYFSSGMKQRVKLILAIFADTPILLLDEPCTNLDKNGIIWYRKLMLDLTGNRTLVVASNQLDEYDFCAHRIQL